MFGTKYSQLLAQRKSDCRFHVLLKHNRLFLQDGGTVDLKLETTWTGVILDEYKNSKSPKIQQIYLYWYTGFNANNVSTAFQESGNQQKKCYFAQNEY